MVYALGYFNDEPFEDSCKKASYSIHNPPCSPIARSSHQLSLTRRGFRAPCKNIGKTDMKTPTTRVKLQSTKQQELIRIRDVFNYEPVSESKLKFAP